MADTKYGHLLKKLNYQEMQYGKSTRLTGSDLEGLELTLSWGYTNIVEETDIGVARHTHPHGECIVFAGLDYDHPNRLGAEIEVDMGTEGEKHILNSTGAIIIPPGLIGSSQ